MEQDQSGALFLVAAAASVPAGLLLVGGLFHLVHSGTLRHALISHRIVGARAVGPIAILVTLAEVGIGCASLFFVSFYPPGGQLRLALFACASLYLAYAVYSLKVLRSGIEAPCGCAGQVAPMSRAILYRAVGASFSAGMAAIIDWPFGVIALGGPAQASLFLTVCVLTLLLWTIPSALRTTDVEEVV